MKKLNRIIAIVFVLLISSSIYAQLKEEVHQTNVAERNPFLLDKRHGAVFTYSYQVKKQPGDLTAERNPFLTGKGHGIVFVNSNDTSPNLATANLVADRNPFLVERRHGAIIKINNMSTEVSGWNKQAKERNIFLEQKRHR